MITLKKLCEDYVSTVLDHLRRNLKEVVVT